MQFAQSLHKNFRSEKRASFVKEVCYYYDINSVMYSCILFFPQMEYTKNIYWTPLVTFLQSLFGLFMMKQALGFQIPWITIF